MEKQTLTLDDVLLKFGMFGRYHLKLMFWFCLAYLTNSLYCSNYIFAVEEVGYRCKDEGFEPNSCHSNVSDQCSEWIYDKPHSFVAEYGLACQDWKRTLVGTVHSFGYMVGLLIVGPLSDKIGRKKALILTGVTGGVLGLARTFSPWYWLYIILEFLESAIGDICSPVYVLNLEIVASKNRVMYYGFCGMGYILGSILLPLAAMEVPYWRNFLRVIYTPAILFFLYQYLVDESPRWLISKGRKEKAIQIIEKAAAQNKLKIDRDSLERLAQEDENKSIKFVELIKMTFSSKALIQRVFICIVWWTTSTFVSYGMMINSVSLQGNKYLNYALISVLDFPGTFIIMYILIYCKRRSSLIVTFLCGAVLCFVQPFLPSDNPWLSILVYMISKLMCSFYFSITYMYTSELFPTYTRNSMHALCSSLGRIGSILAPQTPLLMVYWTGLPSIVFGISAFLAGIITFFAPESANTTLPDTVKEAEAVGSKKGIDNLAMSIENMEKTDELVRFRNSEK